MSDKELWEEYERDCKKAHSNIEAPLMGRIITPICKSCKFSDRSDPYKPKCIVLGDMPKKYRFGDDFNCPEYVIKPNCPHNDLPTPPEERPKR